MKERKKDRKEKKRKAEGRGQRAERGDTHSLHIPICESNLFEIGVLVALAEAEGCREHDHSTPVLGIPKDAT